MSAAWENEPGTAGSGNRAGAGNSGNAATTAKERAGETATAAGEGARHVASEAKMQARNVAVEATVQAGKLYETSRRELMDQADQRARKAAEGLRSWSDQLAALAAGRTDQAGQVRDYVQDAQQRLSSLASRVEQDGISGIADDLSSFARRRPLVFLGTAGIVGFAVGRLVRSAASQNGGTGSDGQRMSSRDWQRGWGSDSELAPPLHEAPVTAQAIPAQRADVPRSSW